MAGQSVYVENKTSNTYHFIWGSMTDPRSKEADIPPDGNPPENQYYHYNSCCTTLRHVRVFKVGANYDDDANMLFDAPLKNISTDNISCRLWGEYPNGDPMHFDCTGW